MEQLTIKDLYREPLVEVNSKELVSRYNQGLEMLGLQPTTLTRFTLDMMGWSPEIAAEQGSNHYLTRSFANPTAMIITINQRNAPLCNSYHSFEKDMITAVYDNYGRQIMDINTTDVLCIDMDNGLSRYSTVDDLLLIDNFVLKAETPGRLLEHVRQQKELVARFMESDALWESDEEREKLRLSGKLYGDLRHRDVQIDPFVYTHLDMFFTEALGGVYVLYDQRKTRRTNPLVIYRNRKALQLADSKKPRMRLMPVTDASLWRLLKQEQYIQVDLDYYRENPHFIDLKKETVLADYACMTTDDYVGWSELKKKNFISTHGADVPELYFELERLQKRLESGEKQDDIELSDKLMACLARPHQRLDLRYHPVVERLLSEMDPGDPIRLFQCDKTRFCRIFSELSDGRKRWLVDHLNLGF